MRKLFLLFWALLATKCLWAHDFVVDGIYYNILYDKTNEVEVTYQGDDCYSYYDEYSGSVTIPETVTYDGTTYSVTSIGVEAFCYCRSLTSITIPNSVTTIGNYAFYYCDGLTSITIPNSVTSIGDWAFYNCSGLTSITIPNSVTSIGYCAFVNCSGLTSITIPNGVTSIGESAFSDCSGLTSVVVEEGNTVYDSRENCNAIIETASNTLIAGCKNTTIPNSVTSIGDYAFYGCSSLTSITIPNSVTSIGNYAFYWCSGLTSITIPNSVTSIGYSAFYGCSSLTSITIPNSVTSIGESAFRYCSGLTSIVVEEGNTVYDSRENCNALIETASNTLITGCKNSIIPNSVTSIGDWAFYKCSSLTSITIPDGVTHIGAETFSGCTSLTTITIPNSVTSIGNAAFGNCSRLCSLTIPNSVTTIAFNAFLTCTFAKDNFINQSSLDAESNNYWGATIVDQDIDGLLIQNDTVIGYRGHQDTIVIPDGVLAIADDVFRYNSKIKSVTIPNSVTSIGQSAFSDCRSLAKTNFTGDIIDWCKIEFGNAYANPINCSHNLYINDIEVKDLIIPEGVTSIGESAFFKCTSLTSVTIGNSVTSIGDAAFFKCTSLTSVTIGNSVTSIGVVAFSGCIFAKDKFINNSYLDAEANNYWGATIVDQIVDGLLIRNDTVIDYTGNKDTIVIPDGVLAIADDVFRYNSKIKSVTIPNSVTSIGKLAFDRCSALTSITIPESVTTIGNNAFEYCTNLTSIVWNPVSCTGFWTEKTTYCIFYGCENVTSITFGDKVTEIPRYLCWKMSKLDSVTIPESVKTIGDYAFSYCHNLKSITVPNSVVDIKQGAFYDCFSLKSVTIGNSVTSIGNYAFDKCSALTSITVPESVTTIGNNAFEYCTNLTSIVWKPVSCTGFWTDKTTYSIFYGCENVTSIVFGENVAEIPKYLCWKMSKLDSVTIPNSVTSIGYSAFYGCTTLTSITIPNSVTSIESYAFYSCSSLTSVTIGNGVKDIGFLAFSGCSALTKTNYTGDVAGWCNIKFGTSNANPIYYSNNFYINDQEITELVIPNTVDSIHAYAFFEYSSLTSITIPNSVISIGDYAFRSCTSLTSLTIPNSVTSIEKFAFYECSALDTIYLEATTPPTIESNTFTNTPASVCYIPCGTKSAYEASAWAQYMGEFVEHAVELTSGICGENLYWEYADTKLIISGTGAMYDNIVECLPWAWLLDSIRSIEMSEGITHIAAYAFDGCSALRELHLPASVLAIGEYAFGNTPRLYEITCLALEPPVADASSFTNYDAYLHAYCDAQRYYSIDPVWKNFHNVECIVTEDEVTGDVTIIPSDYEATVVWLSHADAAAYALVITKNDVTFCTLKFNKYGQLTNIAFAPSRTHHNKQQAAEATPTGYSFTITGLDENTTYGYAFSVLNEESAVIEEFVGEFTTQSNASTAVDNVDASNHSTQKLLRDGQLLILRDGKTYTIMGQEL